MTQEDQAENVGDFPLYKKVLFITSLHASAVTVQYAIDHTLYV